MTAAPHIRLAERGGWTTWPLTAAQLRTLAEHPFLVELRPLGDGRCRLKAKDRVGAVRLGRGEGALQLTVTPKTPIDRLLYLIGCAPRRVMWDDRPVDADPRPDLLPALAHAFCAATRRALQRGVLVDYREVEDTLPVLRGRLRHADQLRRRPGLLLPMEVIYDDHTADIPENQILLGAARRLLRVPGVDAARRAQLTGFIGRLDGVRAPLPGAPVPVWTPNRRNEHYRQALRLAELILRGASYELGDGRTVSVDGMLVRVWQLYEDFLAEALGEELRRKAGGRPSPHDTAHRLDTRGHHKLDPDLIHYLPGGPDGVQRPALIVDATYKTKASREDLYQMLAYCLRLDLSEGHLVYAACTPGVVEIPVSGRTVRIYRHALDLGLPVAELQERISDLADEILRLRTTPFL